MNQQIKILHLDDDPGLLEEVKEYLSAEGYQVFSAANIVAASHVLSLGIDLAIVDLFLEGDEGEELSNNFVRYSLETASVPYLRLSSAPGLVPGDCKGCGVIDKREFRRRPQILLEAVIKIKLLYRAKKLD